MPKKIVGRVHSIETLGTRDGPGLRCVFFLAGCNYRCQFCQNPDTWTMKGSKIITFEEVRERLSTLLPYLTKHHGGVTVSGGEPTMQVDFVIGLFKLAHKMGLSTVLDTNGTCQLSKQTSLLDETDIVLLDIKACDNKLHKKITGKSVTPVLSFGRLVAEKPDRLMLRRVLLPNINDSAKEMEQLAKYACDLPNKPEIELIGYHRLGVHKWEELGKVYPLKNLKPPTEKQWFKAVERLENHGLIVHKE